MTVIRTRLKKTWLLWAPASVVFCAGVLASAGVVNALLDRQDKEEQSRVDHEIELFAASLQLRMTTYADLLRGMQPIFEMSSTHRSRRDFLQKTVVKQLPYRYPGIVSLSVSLRMLPDEYLEYRDSLVAELGEAERVSIEQMPAWDPQRKTYNVVDQIWPEQAASRLVGSDAIAHPAAELYAYKNAPRTTPRMSEPLQLRQLPHGVVGVLISVPFQRLEEAVPRLVGTVNMGVRLDALIEDLQEQGLLRNTAISLSDVGSVLPGNMVQYDEQPLYVSQEWNAMAPGTQGVRSFDILGRSWRLDYASHPQVLSSAERLYPWAAGALGLLTTLLLASMLALAARQRERALLKVQAKNNLLRYRTGRFNALFHQHAIGVAEVNAQTGQFLHVNARFCEIAGELSSRTGRAASRHWHSCAMASRGTTVRFFRCCVRMAAPYGLKCGWLPCASMGVNCLAAILCCCRMSVSAITCSSSYRRVKPIPAKCCVTCRWALSWWVWWAILSSSITSLSP